MFKLLNWIDECQLTNHLSLNPRATQYLQENSYKMSWYHLSQSPQAIHLLERNIDNIDWYRLSSNPGAIHH
jgi:hypothetical protein